MDRTNTTSQSAFVLTGTASVSFDFSRLDHMRITIPAGSTWRVRYHWHQHDHGCKGIQTLKGQIVLWQSRYPSSGFPTIGGGVTRIFKPTERIGWWSKDWPKEPEELIVILDADETLYRNTCSATLDAELFPHLRSTPLWLRLFFAALALWPSAHQGLVRRMLWVQIQAIYHFHGYYEYHGGLPFASWWMFFHFLDWKAPPDWILQLQWKSQTLCSRVTQALCYWSGRMLFGMKGEYVEYTPKKKNDTHNMGQVMDEDKDDMSDGHTAAQHTNRTEKIAHPFTSARKP